MIEVVRWFLINTRDSVAIPIPLLYFYPRRSVASTLTLRQEVIGCSRNDQQLLNEPGYFEKLIR